jgi:lipoate-protein ligase A
LTYSLIMPLSHPLAGRNIRESYVTLCGGILAGLALLGLEASFVPVNDILSGGKKISGNAQTRRLGSLLQHGTILLDSDPELMFSLLRVPQEKFRDKLIAAAKDRVTSLRALLGREVPFAEAAAALAGGFRRALSLDFAPPASPSPAEESRARELAAEKFASRDWLFRR